MTSRRHLRVRGVVQGVGFRPFVFRKAGEMRLTGSVRNLNGAVEIEIQGEPDQIDRFIQAVREQHPAQASIEAIEAREIPARPEMRFVIEESDAGAAPRPALPADLAVCEECLREIHDPGDRRYRYPFTNCTHCGPRFSIVERTPYDRERTAMRIFPMCAECEREYRDPSNRRFHAEPVACPRCGPRLELLDAAGGLLAREDDALRQAARGIAEGRIVAMKGLGGFQLLADAGDESAVQRLRQRKRREAKPFALMLASLEDVRRACVLSGDEARFLASQAAPILLLQRSAHSSTIAPSVAPGNPRLGVMLPATPLHHLVAEACGRPLVCTSGNLSEEPMCLTTEEALERLSGIADLFLTHDRPIVRPVDDSVARVQGGGLQILRRARGFAPRPIPMPGPGPTVLALGAHLKNAVALALGTEAIASAHVGDLESAESRRVLERAANDLCAFYEAVPDAVACDLHPDYASSILSEKLAATWAVPLVTVQHHHAHVAAALLEHGLEGPVLGLSWDGTGLGDDGTIWGGEALVADAAGYRRIATLRPFRLPGGDRAVREPRRSALGLLHAMLEAGVAKVAREWFEEPELEPLLSMVQTGLYSPWTTSMGRLFDVAAVLSGGPTTLAYEGQAAMEFEFALPESGATSAGAYPFPLRDGDPARADWEPLVAAILEDRARGTSRAVMSARFHEAIVDLGVAIARRAGLPRVVLTGGCFQNAYLAARLGERLAGERFSVYEHRAIPPNDGGIAFGQLLVARRRLEGGGDVSRHTG